MLFKNVSARFEIENSNSIDVILEHNGYEMVKKLQEFTPEQIIQEVEKSGLRGKGGGGALAGAKWRLLEKAKGKKYIVINADESEPGTFKDRSIIEKDPHLLIEGIILTAYALNSNDAFIYIRGEYQEQAKILQKAIDEAYEKGFLGDETIHKYNIHLTLHRGAGAYICGEKSALLESLEGKRGHPRLKPHTPSPEYFFNNPTLVNNVETIATIPSIIKNGSSFYKNLGVEPSCGSMLFGVSGHVNKPGIYECEFGVSMLDYINTLGGGVKGESIKAVITGGVSTGVIPFEIVKDIKLTYEDLRKAGSSLGTGGMIVMNESTCMVKALKNILSFYHDESCGQCTPCREGTFWVDATLDKFLDGSATLEDIEILKSNSKIMNGKTVCVFAPSVSTVIDSFLKYFQDEFIAKIKVDV